MTSPGGSEHVSRYRALGEFDNLIRAAHEARRALRELREEEAKLNAQSLADDKKITASKTNRAKAEKESSDSAKRSLEDLRNSGVAGKAGEDTGVAYHRGVGKGIEKDSKAGGNKQFLDAATSALRQAFANAGQASGESFIGGAKEKITKESRNFSQSSNFDQALRNMRDKAGVSGEDTGNKYVQGFATKIRDLNNILHVVGFDKLDLDVDIDDAQQSIKTLEIELTQLSHTTSSPQIRIDTNRALTQLRGLQKLFKDEVAEEIVKDSQRIREELIKIDALPSGKSFKFWAVTAIADMTRVFHEADKGAGIFGRLRQAVTASGSGGGGNFFKSFISGFDQVSESSSNLLQKLGRVSGELYRMPGLIGVLVSAVPGLIAGIGALGGGALGLANALGAAGGALLALPGLAAAGISVIGGLSGAFSDLGATLEAAQKAEASEAEVKEKARLGTDKALTAQQKYKLALAQLSPATQKVTQDLFEFGKGWKNVSQAVGDNFFKEIVGETGKLNKLLPVAQNYFGTSATALGKVADAGIKMISSGPWRRDFGTIAKNNATIIDNMGHAGLSLANVFRNIAVAAGPFTGWLTKGLREGADAFADWSAEARSNGAIGAFLGETQESLESLWQILKNLGGVVNSFFKTTVDEGQSYLRTLEDITQHWRDVAKSQEGANSPLRQWMVNIRPVLSALGALIGDLSRGIGGLASNQSNIETIISLLNSLRTEVLPPILEILQHLNDSGIAVTVTHALGDLLQAISKFLDSGATTALTVFVTVLAKFAELLFGIATLPGISNVLGSVAAGLAAVAAVSVVARFTGLFKIWDFFTWMVRNKGNLAGAFTDVARGVAGLPSTGQAQIPKNIPSTINVGSIGSEVLAAQARETEKVGNSSSVASGKVGIFSRALSGISNAGTAARGALSSVVGFLGGPWGVALTGAVVGISLLSGHLNQQKKDAEDTKNAFQALRGAYGDLREGNIDNLNSLADTDEKLKGVINQAQTYGLSLTDVSGALNNQEQSLSRFNAQIDTQISQLTAARDEQVAYAQSQGDTTGAFNEGIEAINDQIKAAENYKGQVNSVAETQRSQNKTLRDAASLGRTYQQRLAGMTDAQVQTSVAAGDLDSRVRILSNALDTMSSATASSADRSKALGSIIDSQTANMINAAEQTENWSSKLFNFKDTVAASRSQLKKHEDALGTNSRAGLRNRDALEDAAKAARDLYLEDIASGKPMDEATRRHRDRIKELQKEADKAFGANKKTRDLIEAYGDVPEDVKTDITTTGYAKVYQQMQDLKALQASLQSGKSLKEATREVEQSKALADAHGYATGGPVWGPGTRTSDSIRAWLSNGEFVQPTDAVEYYGLPLMEAMRKKKLSKASINEALLEGDSEQFSSGGQAHSKNCQACAAGGHGFATGGRVSWPYPVDNSDTLIKKSWADTVPGGGQFSPGWRNQLNILNRAGFNFHPSPGQLYSGGHAPNSWHYKGRAVDLAPPNDRAWQFLVKNYAKTSKELFWASKNVNYRHGQATGPHDKTNHIHWAYNQGGLVDIMKQLGMDGMAPQQQAALPSTPRTLSPAASSVVNNSTDNARTFGDVIINNPTPERAGDSVRDALYRAQLLY